jgi:hypothetical protein
MIPQRASCVRRDDLSVTTFITGEAITTNVLSNLIGLLREGAMESAEPMRKGEHAVLTNASAFSLPQAPSFHGILKCCLTEFTIRRSSIKSSNMSPGSYSSSCRELAISFLI